MLSVPLRVGVHYCTRTYTTAQSFLGPSYENDPCDLPPHADQHQHQDNRSEEETILSLIHISEPTRLGMISYAVF